METCIFLKKRMILRIITVLLAGLLIFSMPGCGQTSKIKSKGTQFTLWIGLNWIGAADEKTLVGDLLKDQLGFDFKCEYTQGDEMTALNLKLSSNSLPDASVFGAGENVRSALVKANAVMPMEKYFNMPDKYPNLAKIPKMVLKMAASDDGHNWFIPTWWAMEQDNPWPGWTADAWYVRTDILEKTGMKKSDLTTIDGIETFLKKVTALKDPNGRPYLGLGFYAQAGQRYANNLYSTFGMDAAQRGAVEMTLTADGLVPSIDMANYKEAMKWYAKLYRAGLVDPEVVTQKKELFQEKQLAGRTALVMCNAWEAGPDFDNLKGPTSPTYYFTPIDDPKVPGVAKRGPTTAVNPLAGFGLYINKNVDAKKLDSILKFMDWCLEQNPIRQHEANEGPVGKYWRFVDDKKVLWEFDPAYQVERDSGDNARRAKLAPGCNSLWMLTSYSNSWYPWFTYAVLKKDGNPAFIQTFSSTIAKFPGSSRPTHIYDNVIIPKGGVIEKYGPSLLQVRLEFEARLLMSKTEKAFEDTWNEFRSQLEERGHWTEVKKEWNQALVSTKALKGDF